MRRQRAAARQTAGFGNRGWGGERPALARGGGARQALVPACRLAVPTGLPAGSGAAPAQAAPMRSRACSQRAVTKPAASSTATSAATPDQPDALQKWPPSEPITLEPT